MTPLTAPDIVAHLTRLGDAADAANAAAYHKAPRRYLGIRNPVLNDLARDLRSALTPDARLPVAADLWSSDIHEARVLAAKMLTQARIRPDDGPTWDLIASWVPDFDGWAIADHVCDAGARRLVADPARIGEVEVWTTSDAMWSRRAALVMTLPWTKQNHPSPEDAAIRDRVSGWAAAYVPDRNPFIQKAIAWWLRDLSKHDPDRVHAFLALHGAALTGFARTEAARHL